MGAKVQVSALEGGSWQLDMAVLLVTRSPEPYCVQGSRDEMHISLVDEDSDVDKHDRVKSYETNGWPEHVGSSAG